jgi:hypothetical protein
MKLISMTDFVLEQEQQDIKDNFPEETDKYFNACLKYAQFLKTPLSLGMFVPCDEDGNFLQEPDGWNDYLEFPESFDGNKEWYELYAYEEAKEKVIFEGFVFTESQKYSVNNNIQLSVSPYGLKNERLQLTKLENGKFHTWLQLFTVEDLIQCDLECTMSF